MLTAQLDIHSVRKQHYSFCGGHLLKIQSVRSQQLISDEDNDSFKKYS
jgi:hypothetical protein